MFDVGLWELMLLFIIGLVVVGPERLPSLARTVALWINKARRMVSDVRDEVEKELRVEEIKRSIRQEGTVDEMQQLAKRINTINSDLKADVMNVMDAPDPPNTARPKTPNLVKSSSLPPDDAAKLPSDSSTQ
ncbi:MAG: Sec-independent protein translocase protein TatB [Candidatus Competibacteraceae bacterium]|jgi:sec-independent protein translocase protein TatB|nr:Sec-independent protein translocase protein TatB [Candidatus Competibacteraceae bacterium]